MSVQSKLHECFFLDKNSGLSYTFDIQLHYSLMLSIRLSRVGRKNTPLFRMVVMEKSRDPWAKHLEILGQYNPRTNPATINLKTDRIKHWISQGAEMSDTVWNMLVDAKIVEGKKRTVTRISNTRAAKLKTKAEAQKPTEAPKPAEEPKKEEPKAE